MDEFELKQHLKKVLQETDLTDPKDIAAELLDRLPEGDERNLLLSLLVGYVHRYVVNDRGRTAPTSTSSASNLSLLPAPNGGPVFPGSAPSTHGQQGYRRGSPKVSAIRDGWQKHLRARIHTENGWKFFADLTYDDFMFAAAERQLQADRNMAAARRFHHWADLLTEYDVKTFRDLPPEVQMQTLGQVA